MIRKLIIATILVTFVIGMVYSQQSSQSSKESDQQQAKLADETNRVPDEDGGVAFVIRKQEVPFSALTYHGGKVISQAQQVNIFLGRAWAKASNKSRESLFANPVAALSATGKQFLTTHQIELTSSEPLSQEALDFTSPGNTVSDLQIQQTLSDMFEHRWLNAPDDNTIYVLFLAPGVQSTLGQRVGEKHYVAYHNFVHFESVQVHYVVIPFEQDQKTAQQNVSRAIIDTALNPTGDGWY